MALARIMLLRGSSPNDKARTAEYESGAHKGLDDQIQEGLAASSPVRKIRRLNSCANSSRWNASASRKT